MAFLIIPIRKKLVAVKRICLTIGVRVSDVCHRNENFEWVLFVWFADASLDLTLDFCFSLLAVAVTGRNILYQLDEVREDEDGSTHLLKPSSFL